MYLNSWQKHQEPRATVGRYRDMPGQVKDLLVLGARRYSSPVPCAFSTASEHSWGRYTVGPHPVYNCWRALPRNADDEASYAWLGKMGTCKIA